MQPENLQAFIYKRLSHTCSIFYHYRLIVAGVFALLLLLSSCKKLAAAAGDRDALEELFEENFLNKNFVVHYASDAGQDITSQYTGYTFVLTKNNSFYEGPLTGTKNGITYTGTWSSNDDYSKLIINLTSPSNPTEFTFLNRAWRFTKKAVPIMELAPWGSTAQKVLHMQRL
jgi:hypothetical protein